MSTTVSADLHFELDRPGATSVRGHLTGSRNRLRLKTDDPGAFAGPDDASVIRALAAGLAARGITVDVVADGGLLIALGPVRTSWWQRRMTTSRHIRLGSLRGVWTAARARAAGTDGVLPSRVVLPPTSPWPIAPTFLRRVRRSVATTHDPARGGGPRLVLEKEHLWAGERQPVFWLTGPVSTIGSAPQCDVQLAGLAPLQASVRHADDDEFVVEPLGELLDGAVRVHGAEVSGRVVLRTGARIEVGGHVLAYYRDEFADHGRPHHGRIGGELGRQLPQHAQPHDAEES